MNHTKLTIEFTDGWKHFCSCIDWDKTYLDGEAIRFMNEMPSKIIKCLDSQPDLLEACEGLMEKADNGSANFDDPEPGSIYLIAKAAISKAKKE